MRLVMRYFIEQEDGSNPAQIGATDTIQERVASLSDAYSILRRVPAGRSEATTHFCAVPGCEHGSASAVDRAADRENRHEAEQRDGRTYNDTCPQCDRAKCTRHQNVSGERNKTPAKVCSTELTPYEGDGHDGPYVCGQAESHGSHDENSRAFTHRFCE